jgi:F0F1-type ATP synthase membrane subunit b/b'
VRHRFAAPVGLLVAVAVFVAAFLLTRSLWWPPVLAFVAAVGAYLMLDDRSRRQVESDDYAADARERVAEALGRVKRIRSSARSVTNPVARAALEQAGDHVTELFDRVRRRAPNSLYSTASQLNGHLSSLEGVLIQYLDIQAKPALYRDPAALTRSGEQAFTRFAAFTLDSVRLVNQGDMAQYQANLETVAPPELPELTGGQP